MRYRLLIFFLFLTSLSVGQVNTDSIRSIWVSESNEIEDRLDAMYYYSTIVYLRSNPDSAFLLANEMYDLAQKAGKTEYQADALRIQGTSFFNRGNISEALEYYSQSLRLSEQSGYLYGTASAFHKKGKLFAYLGEYQTALEPVVRPYDAATYPGRADPARILIIDAAKDHCIPPDAREALWEVLGRPEHISLNYGHKKAFLSMTPLGFNWMRKQIYRFFDLKLGPAADD